VPWSGPGFSFITAPAPITSSSILIVQYPVAYHNRDLKRKTLATIIDQAGLSVEEFIEIL